MVAATYTIPSVSAEATLYETITVYTPVDFGHLCSKVTNTVVVSSVNWLEADGVKSICDETVSGHAVLLTHALITI